MISVISELDAFHLYLQQIRHFSLISFSKTLFHHCLHFNVRSHKVCTPVASPVTVSAPRQLENRHVLSPQVQTQTRDPSHPSHHHQPQQQIPSVTVSAAFLASVSQYFIYFFLHKNTVGFHCAKNNWFNLLFLSFSFFLCGICTVQYES